MLEELSRGDRLYTGVDWIGALALGPKRRPYVYTVDWRPDRITWSVDGHVVHERVGWDPTPIPHLPMRLHANLWAPRSEELAGRLDPHLLPATARFKNVSVWA